jgi:hypothetical protein
MVSTLTYNLHGAGKSVRATVCCLDHPEVLHTMTRLMSSKGIDATIIMDLNNVVSPCCAKQNVRLAQLFDAARFAQEVQLGHRGQAAGRLQARVFRPPRRGGQRFKSLHCKCWMVDDEI